MTVGELIDRLKAEDRDAEVRIIRLGEFEYSVWAIKTRGAVQGEYDDSTLEEEEEQADRSDVFIITGDQLRPGEDVEGDTTLWGEEE